MKYVGICSFQDYMYALREDGHLYRISHNAFTNIPEVEGVKRMPIAEVEECLRLPMWG